MSAIELADELDGYEPLGGREFIAKVSTMLRQQAKKIEQLEVDVEHYADRWRSACGDLEIEKDFKQLKLRELSDELITENQVLKANLRDVAEKLRSGVSKLQQKTLARVIEEMLEEPK